MRIALLFQLVTLLHIVAYGQERLRGSIMDENKEILAGAHILLLETGAIAISDRSGNFNFQDVPAGPLTLQITFIGYETFVQKVETSTRRVNVFVPASDVHLKDLVIHGSAERAINTLTPLDIQLRPTNSSQDILRIIPGLFIAQHAGGGKAEQIFLRGFDIDHGTDLSLEVDGMPVNMVSHAHGQGYSDLHFVIPELINFVDFDKGPYYANKGNFTTAGFVDFQTKNALEENFIKLEGGQFGTLRAVTGVNLFSPSHATTQGYVGAEFFRSDGFVESPQDFNRFNITSKITSRFKNNDIITTGASFFSSRWDASGQIPQRAVDAGKISRLGSIDNTEGGETRRTNLFINHMHPFSNGGFLTQQAYAIYYDFNLYSNFTFFLNDPIQRDQINQKESRMIYGYKSNYNHAGTLFGKSINTDIGMGLRWDDVNDIALSHTIKRAFIGDRQRGDISEGNIYAYISETVGLSEKWSVNAAARFDHFIFTYHNRLTTTGRSVGKSIVSPKLSVNYQINPSIQLFIKSGLGFHSNDARVVTAGVGDDILPRAFGVDLGVNTKLTDRIFIHAALWHLDLQQELVYVGDEGIVEPSGKTRRAGMDISLRYEIAPWLFFDSDVNVTRPRSREEPEGANYIPLAPTLSGISGLTFNMKNGLNGSLRYRFIADRPANEDHSVIAKGYSIADVVINYTRKKFEVGLSAENIFNATWNEAQFDTVSRLQDEPIPTSEIHFTPGTPLFIKLKATFFF